MDGSLCNMLQDFKKHWEMLLHCCLSHPKDVDINDISEVLFWEIAQDGDGGAICRLKNGKFLVLTEYADYTGHG